MNKYILHKKKEYNTLSVISYFFKKTYKIKFSYFFYSLFEIILNIFFPVINIFAPLWIVSIIQNKKSLNAVAIVILLVISNNFGYNIAKKWVIENRNKINDIYIKKFNLEINKVTRSIEFRQLENSDFLDKCKQAEKGIEVANGLQGIMDNLILISSNLLIALEVTFIVIKYSTSMIIFFVINIIAVSIINEIICKIEKKYFDKNTNQSRKFDYLTNELVDVKYGKEIRLFNAQPMILKEIEKLEKILTNDERKCCKEISKLSFVSVLVNVLLNVYSYMYLTFSVIRKKMKIGQMLMVIEALFTFSQAFKDIISNAILIDKNIFYLNKYKEFIENVKYEERGGVKNISNSKFELEFVNVSFKYPNEKSYVLKNISMKIENGKKIAVVGVNGAGKTTLVKLICRFYKATKGKILLNGIDINKYDYSEYVKKIGAIFQDFQLLAFTIKENITFDNINDIRLENVIEKVDMDEKIKKYKKKYNTYIFKYFDDDGIEFSHGEEQKIAIARALYKNSTLLIMDEPTSAIDSISESELYQKFNNLTKNITTIFISHRLSSCKFCDEIIVFEEGRIIENGTHRELMDIENGKYKKMYLMQSNYYQ